MKINDLRRLQGNLIVGLLSLFCLSNVFALGLTNLRCEYRENPLGIDVTKPRISWVMTSDRRGELQTAWQVLAASSQKLLKQNQGDLWDSGKVDSGQSTQIEYAGKALKSGEFAYWKVRVWDRAGRPSAWSKPAVWSAGLLDQAEWTAKWIGRDDAQKRVSPT